MTSRVVYIISDLHLGGAPPRPDIEATDEASARAQRGFRMMTEPRRLAAFIEKVDDAGAELVINGDFIDFLAEEHGGANPFRPFLYDEDAAIAVLRRIATPSGRREGWDHLVFDALRSILSKGRRVTILLGNHDLELCLPGVREELVRLLGGGQLYFRYDNEALRLGRDVLVEHGNLYDRANVVDHHGLRKLRANTSRGLHEEGATSFEPPVGSRLVCEIMNPIKAKYGFIDLLKPESEPLFTLLLAIEPGAAGRLGALLGLLGDVPIDSVSALRSVAGPQASGAARRGGERSAVRSGMRDGGKRAAEDPLERVLAQVMGKADAGVFLESLSAGAPTTKGPALRSMGSKVWSKLGLLELLVRGDSMDWDRRLEAVRRAMKALEKDLSFNVDSEVKSYAEHADTVAQEGEFRCVVFGHTHLAKDVVLESGARYLNSGTWANVMRFPRLPEDAADARRALQSFAEDIRDNKLASYVRFLPTFVRVELEDERFKDAALHVFEQPDAKLEEQPVFRGMDAR